MNILSEFAGKIKRERRISRHLKDNFPNELLLMKNRHIAESTNRSILYFTIQRCASRYVMSILKKIKHESNMTYIDIEGFFWRGGKSNAAPEDIYKKKGYIYGPYYGLDSEELTIPVPDMHDFRILLILRDPRDVLTSHYFHHAHDPYDNPAQQEFILARSREAAGKSIDEWVMEKAPMIDARYRAYIEKFIDKPNVIFLKYEEMIDDFNGWLNRLVDFTDLDPSENVVQSIIESASFSVKKEDVKSHKRQVTPGDHRRKLQADTIKELNSVFSEVLDKLDYNV